MGSVHMINYSNGFVALRISQDKYKIVEVIGEMPKLGDRLTVQSPRDLGKGKAVNENSNMTINIYVQNMAYGEHELLNHMDIKNSRQWDRVESSD